MFLNNAIKLGIHIYSSLYIRNIVELVPQMNAQVNLANLENNQVKRRRDLLKYLTTFGFGSQWERKILTMEVSISLCIKLLIFYLIFFIVTML